MFNRKLNRTQIGLMLGAALIAALSTTACSSGTADIAARPTKQGTIQLDVLKVGMPESSIKDAIMTFAEDPKGAVAGKTQYLSRTYDNNGGQYIVQCWDGQVHELQVYYLNNPVSKEDAVKKMAQVMPSDLPPQSRVDDSTMKSANPAEIYYYGDTYKGELQYVDKDPTRVKMVNVWLISKHTAEAPKTKS